MYGDFTDLKLNLNTVRLNKVKMKQKEGREYFCD